MAAASTISLSGGLTAPRPWRRWQLLLAPLMAGAALLAITALLSRADEVTHIPGWNAAALLIAAMAALAASLRGAREATTDVDRQVRLMLGGAAAFYAFGQMAHLVGTVSGLRPFTVVQGCGLLIAGFGCATWSAELDPSVKFRQAAARIRGWLPLAAVATSSGLIIGSELLTDHQDGIGLAADALLAVVLLLCVVRQTMLLRE